MPLSCCTVCVPSSPQTLRRAALTSQAAFLSTVLPGDSRSSGNNNNITQRSGSSPPGAPLMQPARPTPKSITDKVPDENYRTLSLGAVDGGDASATDLRAASGSNHGNGIRSSSSAADRAALAQWESLQRLQQQSFGLGSVAEHQIRRALELCRDVRGWKVNHDGPSRSRTHSSFMIFFLQGFRWYCICRRILYESCSSERSWLRRRVLCVCVFRKMQTCSCSRVV